MHVVEALVGKRFRQALARELREAPRARDQPDIDELFDFVPAQQRDEVRKRVGRMPDGVKLEGR
jgi:hypothetical protein